MEACKQKYDEIPLNRSAGTVHIKIMKKQYSFQNHPCQ